MLGRIQHPIKRVFRHLFSSTEEREQLAYLLEAASPALPLGERLVWLEQLVAWIRVGATGGMHNTRLRFLLQRMESNPAWKTKFAATLRSLVRDTSVRNLLTEVGVGRHRGFFAEAMERVMTRLLPTPPDESDLARLFLRIFKQEEDAVWVAEIPAELWGQLRAAVAQGDLEPETLYRGWRQDLRSAILILGSRVGTQGTLPEVVERLGVAGSLTDLPFLRLSTSLGALVDGEGDIASCREQNEACRNLVKVAYQRLEESGVSVALVYTLENLLETSRRIDRLLTLLEPTEHSTALVDFLGRLVKSRVQQGSLRSLVRANLHLVASKVVERAGASGEHYITHTRPEYYLMVRAGLGGGAIMAFTTLFKFTIKSWHPALFAEGVFFSINYAASFVLLQLLGYTLATKQPSATASALAVKLGEFEEDGEVRGWVNLVCAMTRTQFAALVGNLLMLVPVAFALDTAYHQLSGSHFLSEHAATGVIDSLHPLTSFTLPMAALTGVLLWISSLSAGWFENWVVFRRLPESLATHRRLVRAFGERGARRIGDWLLHNASLLGGNISLGILMAVLSISGPFFGLPLDVRHVTLSSASLVFALCTLGRHAPLHAALAATLGCLLVGALNFAVGYSLSGIVAARARNVPRGALRRLGRALRVRFRHAPTAFFFPPPREHATPQEV